MADTVKVGQVWEEEFPPHRLVKVTRLWGDSVSWEGVAGTLLWAAGPVFMFARDHSFVEDPDA